MANNIYIDTNIFIDLLDSTRATYRGSFDFIKDAISSKQTLFLNSDTVTNAYYILNKSNKLQSKDLAQFIKKIISMFVVVSIDNSDVIRALDLCIDENCLQKDYEDALQYICAKKIGADLIVTNDKGFVSLDIEVKSSL